MQNVILFDGICHFCNRTVNVILRHDKTNYFQFAPSQSNAALNILQQFSVVENSIASVILIDNDKVYTNTDAVIQIATHLAGWPSIFRFLRLVPKPIRDFAYELIAKNRYTLFGKRDSCRIPKASERNRFLE